MLSFQLTFLRGWGHIFLTVRAQGLNGRILGLYLEIRYRSAQRRSSKHFRQIRTSLYSTVP